MLTDEVLRQMAQQYPLYGNGFSTFDIGKWFWVRYKGVNWEEYCDDLITHIEVRAFSMGFRPDPAARGVYHRD